MSTTLTISACHRLPTAPPTPCATLRAPHIWHATTAQTPISTANRPIFVNSINMQRPPPARHAFGTPMEQADPVSGTNPKNPHVGLVWIPSLRGAKSVTEMPTASLMTMEVGYAPLAGAVGAADWGWSETMQYQASDHPPALRATSRQREDQPINYPRNKSPALPTPPGTPRPCAGSRWRTARAPTWR